MKLIYNFMNVSDIILMIKGYLNNKYSIMLYGKFNNLKENSNEKNHENLEYKVFYFREFEINLN